jgi:hypothetical protein
VNLLALALFYQTLGEIDSMSTNVKPDSEDLITPILEAASFGI